MRKTFFCSFGTHNKYYSAIRKCFFCLLNFLQIPADCRFIIIIKESLEPGKRYLFTIQ